MTINVAVADEQVAYTLWEITLTTHLAVRTFVSYAQTQSSQ